jgi:hypothetical protein
MSAPGDTSDWPWVFVEINDQNLAANLQGDPLPGLGPCPHCRSPFGCQFG